MGSPVVEIRQGKLKGGVLTDINGGNIFSFLGIPYAKPPLGELRFKAPLPAESWNGIRDATHEGDISYSKYELTALEEGSEDCLHLNVFTRDLPQSSQKLKPVMVYIHGGGFVWGSNKLSLYGPEFLLSEDIVLVTIKYRLGVLGFLSLEDVSLGVPGNAGLKDQALALKWVQENIKNFNGDPNNVTIFGESAGSRSVHFHVLSQTSKGLFHKAILQSGTALNFWAYGSHIGKELAKLLGHDVSDEKEALDVLKNTPVEKLFEAQEKLKDGVVPSQKRLLGPVIEKPNETAFITKNAIDIITSGEHNKVPMVIGYTSKEGLVVEAIQRLMIPANKRVEKATPVEKETFKLEDAIPWQINFDKKSEKFQSVCKKILEVYFKVPDDPDNKITFISDSAFVAVIMGSVKNHKATSQLPIFLYRMTLDAGLNYFKNITKLNHYQGACHADDLGYLFKSVVTPEIKPGSLEDVSVRRFVKLWANFAKYGNPTHNKDDLGVTWTPVEEGTYNFLDIGEDLTVGVNPEPERMALWREIFQLSPETAKYL